MRSAMSKNNGERKSKPPPARRISTLRLTKRYAAPDEATGSIAWESVPPPVGLAKRDVRSMSVAKDPDT
jgi:hypothetical protein